MRLELLDINDFIEKNKLKPVTTVRLYEKVGKTDPAGLFSEEIFGKFGSSERRRNFAYINLKVTIIHPEAYSIVTGLDPSISKLLANKAKYVITKEGILELDPPVTTSEMQSTIQKSAQTILVSKGSPASDAGVRISASFVYGSEYSVITNTFTSTANLSSWPVVFEGTIYEFSLKNYSNTYVYTNRVVTDSNKSVITGEYSDSVSPRYVLSLRIKTIQEYNIQLTINSVLTDCVLQVKLLNEAVSGDLSNSFLKNYTIWKSTGASGNLKLLFESFDLQTKKVTYHIVIAAADIVGNYIKLSTNFGNYKISLLTTDGAPLDFPKNGTDLILPLVINM